MQDESKADDLFMDTMSGNTIDDDLNLMMVLKRLRRMSLCKSEVALQNHDTREMTNNELLTHYLVVLRRYIDYLLGKNHYARNRFQVLWNKSLLRRMSVEHMMIIHSFFCTHIPPDIELIPDLVVAFLGSPDLIPIRYRYHYYDRYYRLVNQQIPISPDDSRPHYRAYVKGLCDDSSDSEQRLPEELLEIIQEDSVDATEIMLNFMGETWSIKVFARALETQAINVIRHFAQILPLDSDEFSVYDCIIHTLKSVPDHDSDFAIAVLNIFEDEHPGILRNYHDDYGNNLLKFLGERGSSSMGLKKTIESVQKNCPQLISYLIDAGCDPDEKNTLFMSFNDFAK